MGKTPSLKGKLKPNKALEGKVRRHCNHYIPTRKENPHIYSIRTIFFSGLETKADEPEGSKYWDIFYKARNLFLTDLSIKHIEMTMTKKLTPNLSNTIMQHDR